jgi:pilus assembly protein CpaE
MVIVVAAPKGGVGKSSVSTNLAAYMGVKLKASGKSVCLIDTNIQNSDVGKILGMYRPTVVDLARHAGDLQPQLIQQNMVVKKDLNLYALLGPESPEKASPAYINGRLYRDIVNELRSSFSYIIVDTSVADFYHDIFMNFIIPEMDYMLMLTIPNYTTILNVDQHLRAITHDRHAGGYGVDPRKIGWVLNQGQEGVGADEREVREELATWKYLGQIPYSTEWVKAMNNFELIATRNFPDVNAAFDTILYQITGDEAFIPAQPVKAKRSGGFLPKFLTKGRP